MAIYSELLSVEGSSIIPQLGHEICTKNGLHANAKCPLYLFLVFATQN
jgi:hypothetical protein